MSQEEENVETSEKVGRQPLHSCFFVGGWTKVMVYVDYYEYMTITYDVLIRKYSFVWNKVKRRICNIPAMSDRP